MVAACQDLSDRLACRLDVLLEQYHCLVFAPGAAQFKESGVLPLGLVHAALGEQQFETHIAVAAQIDLGDQFQCLGRLAALVEVA